MRKTTAQHIRPTGQTACPVVGIGASAGGLEAFRRLLSRLEASLGMAYVFVQHLDPTHQSLLPGLLSQMTVMPVQEVQEGMVVQPDTVYVVPTGAAIALLSGVFSLRPFSRQEGQRAAIDHFFTSLAEASHVPTIGIILSGTASDGVAGLQTIKAKGGITFAQDEHSASFPQMPHNAIAAGCVDAVLSPEAIAEALGRISRNQDITQAPLPGAELPKAELPEADLPGVEPSIIRLLLLLKATYDVDFLRYKPNTLLRRIQHRMAILSLETLSVYATYVVTHPAELETLFQQVLIPTTSFFRDPEVYATLTQSVFPELFERQPIGEPIKIWVPACSTGEEAYSLLICLLEALGERAHTPPIQLFATDINTKALAFARAGIYSASQVKSISAERLARFFVPVDQTHRSYQIVREVREHCVFATHNLLKDPPFSHVDLLSCRNLLIYLQAHAQKQVLQTLHYALGPQGVLLLGSSESVDPLSRLFRRIEHHQKLYQKKATSDRLLPPHLIVREGLAQSPSLEGGTEMLDEEHAGMDLQRATEQVLLTQYVPASVVCDAEMEILSVHGHTGLYLEPAQGKVSFNLLRMARPGLVLGCRSAFTQARASHQKVTKEGLQVNVDGKTSEVRLTVLPLTPSEEPLYFLVIFEKVEYATSVQIEGAPTRPKRGGHGAKEAASTQRIAALEQEIEMMRTEMAVMLEEHQAALEELQTSNEETRSSNEELQTLNEELETSQEELQVVNEELATTNEELHIHYEQTKAAQEYAEAVVETVREPLLVLSADLRIERANAAFYQFFQTVPQEVEGRLLEDLGDGQWKILRLLQLLEHIISTHQSFQGFEVQHIFPAIGRKVMLLNARLLVQIDAQVKKPLILLALEDITAQHELELERQKETLLGMVSHELKTPLTSALLYTELLDEIFEQVGNAQATSHLQKLIEQLGHLSHYIGDLLDATATEAGTLQLYPTAFAIDELVANSVEVLQHANPHTRLLIEGEAHASVFADRERAGQVLINLLSNAIKYGISTSPIYVRIKVSEDLVTVRVQDHGKGIPTEQQTRIFERFYRGMDTSQSGVPGLGLGLYLAAKLAKQQGGAIEVESTIGAGTTFSFTLPRQSASL